jgi:RHS repeat-associated protein
MSILFHKLFENFLEPEMVTGTDYYAFGSAMRVAGEGAYRFGFNGKEKDNEVKGGDGLQQDYGMRIYDSRLERFLSVSLHLPPSISGNPASNIILNGRKTLYLITENGPGKS